MKDYPILQGEWKTPAGNPARMSYRGDTNDWSVCTSIFTADEYRLPRDISGVAFDLGAHIGAATVALALDNPRLRVVAVEPVPDNVRLLVENVNANGIRERVTVIPGAIAGPGEAEVRVWWGRQGTVSLDHHTFIGTNSVAYDRGGSGDPVETTVRGYSLPALLAAIGAEEVDFVKTDAEGAEHAFFCDPEWNRRVAVIRGEWDAVRGMDRAAFAALFLPTHDIEFSGPEAGPGGFSAVRRC